MKDREFVEQDLVEAQLSQQANAENQAQALSLSKKLLSAAKGTKSSTRGCLHSCCRFRGRGKGRYSRRLNSGPETQGNSANVIGDDDDANQQIRPTQVELRNINKPQQKHQQQQQLQSNQGYRIAPTDANLSSSLRQRSTGSSTGNRDATTTTTITDGDRTRRPAPSQEAQDQAQHQSQHAHEQAGPSTSRDPN